MKQGDIIKKLIGIFEIFILCLIFFNTEVFANGDNIRVICYDIAENKVIEDYEHTGLNYSGAYIDRKNIDGYYGVGSSLKEIIFGIDKEVEFLYEKKSLEYRTHYNYIKGYPDGKFYPDKNVTHGEVLNIFYNIKELRRYESLPFNTKIWFDESFVYFKEYHNDIFNLGKNFNPDENMTKKDFIIKAINYVDKNANKSVMDAYLQLDTIQRNEYITRGECVLIINKLLKRDKVILTKPHFKSVYNDVDETHPLFNDITEASVTHNYIDFDNAEQWLSVEK